MNKNPAELIEALKQAAIPLVVFLRENSNPHCEVTVTVDRVQLKEDIVGLVLKYEEPSAIIKPV